jgi:hypothetical protein
MSRRWALTLRRFAPLGAFVSLFTFFGVLGIAPSVAANRVPQMPTPRVGLMAASLGGQQVIVAGGSTSRYFGSLSGSPSASVSIAEIYQGGRHRWISAPPMSVSRDYGAAASLPGGFAFVAGGANANESLSSTEVYADRVGWSGRAPMPTSRLGAVAAPLPGNRVLVAGGATLNSHYAANAFTILSSAEIFNESKNSWLPAAPMPTGRVFAAATALSNGMVLVAGGDGPTGALRSVLLYNPSTNRWTSMSQLPKGLAGLTMASLPGSRALAIGGVNNSTAIEPSSNVPGAVTISGYARGFTASSTILEFNVTHDAWSTVAPLPTPLAGAASSALPGGRVLVAGGSSGKTPTYMTMIFDARSNKWS